MLNYTNFASLKKLLGSIRAKIYFVVFILVIGVKLEKSGDRTPGKNVIGVQLVQRVQRVQLVQLGGA